MKRSFFHSRAGQLAVWSALIAEVVVTGMLLFGGLGLERIPQTFVASLLYGVTIGVPLVWLQPWMHTRMERRSLAVRTLASAVVTTSVSILGIDGRNGFRHEGERRPANLEDVFVLLTGEEIA